MRSRRLISSSIVSLMLAVFIGGSVAMPVRAAAAPKNCTAAAPVTLRQGDTGQCVVVLQGLLAGKGFFKVAAQPTFGPATKAAVVSFQRTAGLTPDGIAGNNTWTALKKPGAVTPAGVPAACLRSGKVICVDKYGKTFGTMWALQDRKVVIGPVKISTGDGRGSKYKTFEGTRKVFYMHKDHVSSIYKVAMPYSIFFYDDQALHQGGLTASHGCIHVPGQAAADLYGFADRQTYVTVTK